MPKLNEITSLEQISILINKIRNLRKGFITNFYSDVLKNQIWVDNHDFWFIEYEEVIFLFKRNNDFWNLFYIATSIDSIISNIDFIKDLIYPKKLILDIIGRQQQCIELCDKFNMVGFSKLNVLSRFVRLRKYEESKIDTSVRFASVDDLILINKSLHLYFNAQLEQIPYERELINYIENKQILVCVNNDVIVGFLIFESMSSTIYLRYWLTIPKYRNTKVGSRLLKAFFKIGEDTKRQILWVLYDNTNAIERYKYYGFVEEGLYDYILTN